MSDNKETIIIAMLEDLKSLIKSSKETKLDLTKVENLTKKMEQTTATAEETITKIGSIIEQVRQPVVSRRRITIEIVSKEVIFICVTMALTIAVMGSMLYFKTRPNYDRIDNDLKYRYIKMKGEATSQRISDLEDLFEINRDNTKIRQMQTDIEDYERAIIEKVTLEEQARLRQLEAEKLNNEANSIKNK